MSFKGTGRDEGLRGEAPLVEVNGMTEPSLTRIKNGWAATSTQQGDRWAVHGATQEEALRKFEEAERRHKEIMARPPFHERLANT